MQAKLKFVDILKQRRKDCDLLWAIRSMDPLLPHKLPSESRYSRKEIIKEVLSDPRVKSVIQSLATSNNVKPAVVEAAARKIVNVMASKANLVTVRCLSIFITKALKRILLSIYINEDILLHLKKEMQISQVQYVYAPSHRSEILRKTGAFYMRRSFCDDPLYKEVFRAYVNSVVCHSDRAIEFFIEGTRSRSLKSIAPKYGLLSIMLEALLEGNVPDIQFVPMSISYERPAEELLFSYELLGIPKPKESTSALFRSLSIMQKPYAYGRVFFNLGQPISASHFLSVTQRRQKILNPSLKLSSVVVEDLAYSIIESHKKQTTLMPFNFIALLFNERIQTDLQEPYTLDTLTEDYIWCKNFIQSLNTTVYPSTTSNNIKNIKNEILESLKLQQELLIFDASNKLRLKQRHVNPNTEESVHIKGHSLSQETMRIAVSAINITIYVNPILTFLIKPAFITLLIKPDGTLIEEAFREYILLKTLFSTEFAWPLKISESEMKDEWEQSLNILQREDCLSIQNNMLYHGKNKKLFSLLHNLVLPYIDAAIITCDVLFEWNESIFGQATNRRILVESQKRAEKALQDIARSGHPYCLSLDLFSSTLFNLVTQGIVKKRREDGVYLADKIKLAHLLVRLQSLILQRPANSYLNAILLPFTSETSINMQAKL
ncbi:hypothetical protein KM043_009520 [Ampulex compressa]|nr:hypothetical protein KM043_009520 [Ampulex compressa]